MSVCVTVIATCLLFSLAVSVPTVDSIPRKMPEEPKSLAEIDIVLRIRGDEVIALKSGRPFTEFALNSNNRTLILGSEDMTWIALNTQLPVNISSIRLTSSNESICLPQIPKFTIERYVCEHHCFWTCVDTWTLGLGTVVSFITTA